jgi:very-short-patch-repair endonuclease
MAASTDLQKNRIADSRRDRLLESEGYRVLRFWNGEIIENIDGVMEAIRRMLETSAPHPER